MIRCTYPIPRIDELINFLGGATVFTEFDANTEYRQVAVRAEDEDKNAFLCLLGSCRFKQLHFGLKNALTAFQAPSISSLTASSGGHASYT